VTAMIFWLKNRRPAQWRDVQKVDPAVRLRSPAEILEDLRQDVIAMGSLPTPIEVEPVDKGQHRLPDQISGRIVRR
jgi:hypothetical protein